MLRTIDTNVLVRALIIEDSPHSTAAAAVLARGTIYIPLTVLLETEWVLRSSFGVGRQAISAYFIGLFGLDHVIFEARSVALAAVRAYRDHGFDFADALHLHTAGPSLALVTFDKAFVRTAPRLQNVCAVVSVDHDSKEFNKV